MLKKVLLLSISLGTISNSISMDSIIMDRYNIPISITMGTVVGIGSRLYTKNPVYNIGIGLGIGIGTGIAAYFISRLFSNDEHVNPQDSVNHSAGNTEHNLNPINHESNPQNDITNIDEINQEELQKELDSLGNYLNKSYREIYNEIISNNRFYEDNPEHVDLFWKSAEKGLLNIFKDLISKGADINANDNDNDGYTPLHFASYYGHLPIVEYLVNNRADINAKDIHGNTPLHIASEEGLLDIVELLVNNNADVNAKGYNDATPLHYASHAGHLSVVQYLINNVANKIDVKDNNGNTPLHLASFNGHLNVVEYLVNNGAEVNAMDKYGYTPLHDASSNGQLSVVELLTKVNGVDINAQDYEGDTPLDITNNEKIKKLLISHGAKTKDQLAQESEVN